MSGSSFFGFFGIASMALLASDTSKNVRGSEPSSQSTAPQSQTLPKGLRSADPQNGNIGGYN